MPMLVLMVILDFLGSIASPDIKESQTEFQVSQFHDGRTCMTWDKLLQMIGPGINVCYTYALAGAGHLSRLDRVHDVLTTGPGSGIVMNPDEAIYKEFLDLA